MAKKKATKKRSGKINIKEAKKVLAKADNPNHKDDFFNLLQKAATTKV